MDSKHNKMEALRELSDEALLEQCGADNVLAFNELFDRYAPRLYKLGMRYLKDRFAVEELAIDLLFNIWERRHDIQLEGKCSSYLFRAMHNKAISYLRKTRVATIDIGELPESTFQAEHSADHSMIVRDTEQSFREKLAQLSPQRRKVFELSRIHHMSYAEIAQELNLSQNTVENHMAAALSFLRQQYRERPAFVVLSVSSAILLS
jgi:RNA polymerase sigma-70 factor (family 1)